MKHSEPGSISQAIVLLQEQDEEAAALLWNRFFERLCSYAQTKVYKRHRRLFDEEDIAGSAIFALYEGISKKRFDDLKTRDDLWHMLTKIAARKATNQRKHHDRVKRGAGKVRGDSAFQPAGIDSVADDIQNDGNNGEFVEFEMTCQELLNMLPDEGYRNVAMMRIKGYSNEEMAKKLNCAVRTIERKLAAIRKIWARLDTEQ